MTDSKMILLDFLHDEIVVNHHADLSVAEALTMIEKRRLRPSVAKDEEHLQRLVIVEQELRRYPAAVTLLDIKIQEESNPD